MSWKFRSSKYKNAAPRFPKREGYIQDIPCGALMQSCGNHIGASCLFMAFNVDSGGGGNLGILPLNQTGRMTSSSLPLLKGHSDFVTDMQFSSFDDSCLATSSYDCTAKLWKLPEKDMLFEGLSSLNPVVTLPAQERRVENVVWNPIADNILAVSSHTAVRVYDMNTGAEKYVQEGHGDQIQGVSWRRNGATMATTCKDKKLRVIDPRTSSVAQECNGHHSNKDSRVLWLGDKPFILTTGFSMSREREVKVWDSRNMNSAVKTNGRGTSTGTLMPLHDVDTDMLFLIGKADTSIQYLEFTGVDPYLTDNSVERIDQIKGAAMVPKRAMDVMEGEVNRLLLLIQNSIIPLPYIVPRKTYKDFHADLFPDTAGPVPALSADQWCSGQDGEVSLVSLDPSKQSIQNTFQPAKPKKAETKGSSNTPKLDSNGNASSAAGQPNPVRQELSSRSPASAGPEQGSVNNFVEEEPRKVPVKKFAGVRSSKFRHLKSEIGHRSTHVENIKRLSTTVPGESNMFCANTKRCAVPMEGSGGLLYVLELTKPGKLADDGLPVVENGSKVDDFVWDPFDDCRLVVGCDDAKIRIWRIPESGLTEKLSEPDGYLKGHTEKLYFLLFHPLAKDVLLSSSYDLTVKIWDVGTCEEKISTTSHPDQVFCADWSPDGKYFTTVCKDGQLRVFEPRVSLEPIKVSVEREVGSGALVGRGARVVWVLNAKYIVISGFTRGSSRSIQIYSSSDFSAPLHSVELDISPSILIPYYDEDSATILLTGRGDSTVYGFEVSDEAPHLFDLSVCKMPTLHQGMAFLPKKCCDVRKVEFAKAYRLTNTTVEPLSFAVPRVKTEYFQDDIFPDTAVTWEPVMTSTEWFSGLNKVQPKVSLRPTDMKLLSEAPVEAPKPKKYESFNPDTYKSDDQKKEELMSAVVNKLEIKENPLPQDLADGVDSDEWDDY